MSKQQNLAQALRFHYEALTKAPESKKRGFIGFDGFTDEILTAISTRNSFSSMIPMKKIREFGQRILEASERSGNIELSLRQVKLGGNAPILTDALLHGGHLITFAGSIGDKDQIEPIFQEMANGCEEVFTLGPSSHSDAIEFEDGKIILGKLDNLKNINYDNLLQIVGKEKLKEIFERSDLFISANWTMLTSMNHLWASILKDIFPISKKERFLFVDLADPAKRSDADLKEALRLLQEFSSFYTVIQGLNEAEAVRVAKVLSIPILGHSEDHILSLAKNIKIKSSLNQVIIHSTRFACGATDEGSWIVHGPYTPTPFITTGAGDNFNAGFCNALLYGLNTEQALLSGVATSGFYVRTGKSPSIHELCGFLENWR
ncbi:MAG: PfkB family carbohydrate kinase [Parachlamydiaceae bacterium]